MDVQGNSQTNCVLWMHSLATQPETERNPKGTHKTTKKACLMITRGMNSTPTAGMEAILGLEPLDIHLKGIALSTYARIENAENWAPQKSELLWRKAHTKQVEELQKEIPELEYPTSLLKPKIMMAPSYSTNIQSREAITDKGKVRPKPKQPNTIHCFTDGSKINKGSGAGYLIMGENIRSTGTITLGEDATVFQAEVFAITDASRKLISLQTKNKNIEFFIDNQGAIKAMESYTTNSKVILEAKQTLKELAKNNQITLNWIPGHEGHMGNEIADRLAKRGASQVMMGPKPSVPIQNNFIKNSIREWCKQKHQKTWSQQTDCRQTKWTTPQVGEWYKDLMKLKTQDLRIGTQLLTGHANLQRHRYLMKLGRISNLSKM